MIVLITAECMEGVRKVKDMLRQRFSIKDLGEAKMYLGVHITRDRRRGPWIFGLQRYITALEDRFKEELSTMHNVRTPIAPDILGKI